MPTTQSTLGCLRPTREFNMMQTTWATTSAGERRSTDDRRHFSAKTIVYGAKYARRSKVRREEDHRFAHLDYYSRWLMVFSVGILLFSVTDATLTLHLLSNGAIEANPIMDYFIQLGVVPFVVSKMLMTSIPLVLLTATSNHFLFNRIRISVIFPMILAFYAGLIIYEIILISWI